MTKEEAKKILACRGNGYLEEDFNNAIEVAFNCIPSLPSNLDEAASEYRKTIGSWKDEFGECWFSDKKWRTHSKPERNGRRSR